MNGEQPHELSYEDREGFLASGRSVAPDDRRASGRDWNLWRPEHFHEEYAALLDRIDQALKGSPTEKRTKVFLGNVPHVTVAPLAKGFGPTTNVNARLYFKYYSYFFLADDRVPDPLYPALTIHEALLIDDSIDQFNASIRDLAKAHNEQVGYKRFHVVDINRVLSELAWKRNAGNPTYQWPDALKFLNPPISTKFYHVNRRGNFVQGGIVTLDGVHPSTIGHGLIAREFLQEMKDAGVTRADGHVVDPEGLEWDRILQQDSLYSRPVSIMQELYENETLVDLVTRIMNVFPS
ncbi:MAG: hypothetical protein AAGD10_12350 [Myxococcota bacterium]